MFFFFWGGGGGTFQLLTPDCEKLILCYRKSVLDTKRTTRRTLVVTITSVELSLNLPVSCLDGNPCSIFGLLNSELLSPVKSFELLRFISNTSFCDPGSEGSPKAKWSIQILKAVFSLQFESESNKHLLLFFTSDLAEYIIFVGKNSSTFTGHKLFIARAFSSTKYYPILRKITERTLLAFDIYFAWRVTNILKIKKIKKSPSPETKCSSPPLVRPCRHLPILTEKPGYGLNSRHRLHYWS